MSKHAQKSEESRLVDLRDEAWIEYVYPRPAVGALTEPPIGCGFLRAAQVYEVELGKQVQLTRQLAQEQKRKVIEARAIAQKMLGNAASGPERDDIERVILLLDEALLPLRTIEGT